MMNDNACFIFVLSLEYSIHISNEEKYTCNASKCQLAL